jgi:quinoprotein glucose dehydrogenase
MGNMFLPPGTTGQVMFPGFDGGAEWGGASYDPLTQVLYVNANQVPWALTMVPSGTQTPASSLSGKDYGHSVYEDHCMTCHGADRKGSGDYPSLRTIGTKYSDKQILGIIDHGRGMMPSFKQLPGKDKEAVVAFLLGLKQKKRLAARENEKAPQESFPGAAYRMTGYIKLHTPEGYPASTPPWGTLTAINLNSGKSLWQVPLGEYPELARKGVATTGTENYGGAVVTAGGLLFIAATLDGKIRAFDKSTGTLVWEGKLPAAGFATPVTYAVNGKQYLVVACGGGKLDVPSGDAYVAFALP